MSFPITHYGIRIGAIRNLFECRGWISRESYTWLLNFWEDKQTPTDEELVTAVFKKFTDAVALEEITKRLTK